VSRRAQHAAATASAQISPVWLQAFTAAPERRSSSRHIDRVLSDAGGLSNGTPARCACRLARAVVAGNGGSSSTPGRIRSRSRGDRRGSNELTPRSARKAGATAHTPPHP
jgi:hypothetical protein